MTPPGTWGTGSRLAGLDGDAGFPLRLALRLVVGFRREDAAVEHAHDALRRGGQEVIELLSRLHVGGQTILMVTHDAQVAAAAQRIVRMLDGRILAPEAQDEPQSQPQRDVSVAVEAR